MKAAKNLDRIEAIRELRKMIRPGATVYTIIRHVSSSGMSRHIDCYIIRKGEMRYLSGYVAKALRYSRTEGGSLKVSGCGMDMCFHVVYELGRVLFPKGFIPAKFGGHGRNSTPATDRDTDGGYALKNYTL